MIVLPWPLVSKQLSAGMSHLLYTVGCGLPDEILGDQAGRPRCYHELQAPDHAQGQLPQAHLPARERSQVCRPWTQEGLQSHQYYGVCVCGGGGGGRGWYMYICNPEIVGQFVYINPMSINS